MPERLRVRTTDTHLHFASSTAVPLDVASISPAPDHLVANHALALYLHQSLLQGVIERAQLAGQKTTNRELLKLLRQTGMKVEDPQGPVSDVVIGIEFAEVDPVTVEIGEEETRVVLRATFRPAGQSFLPPFEVTLPYRMEDLEDAWELKTGSIRVKSLDGKSDGTSLTETTVRNVITTSLPKVRIPKQLPEIVWPRGKTPPRVTSIRSANGWIVIGVN